MELRIVGRDAGSGLADRLTVAFGGARVSLEGDRLQVDAC